MSRMRIWVVSRRGTIRTSLRKKIVASENGDEVYYEKWTFDNAVITRSAMIFLSGVRRRVVFIRAVMMFMRVVELYLTRVGARVGKECLRILRNVTMRKIRDITIISVGVSGRGIMSRNFILSMVIRTELSLGDAEEPRLHRKFAELKLAHLKFETLIFATLEVSNAKS